MSHSQPRAWRDLFPIAPGLRLLLLILMVATASTRPGSWNDASRMATVQSLVESGSFVIDRTAFVGTGDKVFINGHFYSEKPPMPSVLGAAVYLPLHRLGIRLHAGRSLAYYLVTLLTIKLFWLLGALAFYASLRFTGLDPEKRFLVSLALGIGSLYFSWALVFNNHALAAACLSIGFYFLLSARHGAAVRRNLGAAAFFLLFAGTADMPTGIFYVLFLPYVLRDPRLRSGVVFYLLPILVTFVPALAINYSIHGSIMPVQIVRSYFEYPGSPWIGSEKLSGVRVNDLRFALTYAAGLFVGPKGFLLYNPMLGVALWGLVRAVRQKGHFFHEALVVGAGSVTLVLYYTLTTSDYGGWCYGIRWFVPLLPLLLFFVYPYFEAYTERRATLFSVLLSVSILVATVGATNPWSDPSLATLPLVGNIKDLSSRLYEFVRAGVGQWTF